MQIAGTINGEIVREYLKEMLLPSLKAGDIIVLDNASIHTSKGLKQLVEDAGCKLLFLPTYSPDLNPIERMWSKVKAMIRKLRKSCESINEAIQKAFNSVTTSDCQGYFREFNRNVHTAEPLLI